MGFDYQRYLASREWAEKKEAIKRRGNGRCERCGVNPHESVHHLTYQRIGNESLDDLLGVCNACHEFLSAKSDYDPVNDRIAFVVVMTRRNGHKFTGDWLDSVRRCHARTAYVHITPEMQERLDAYMENEWKPPHFRKSEVEPA